MPEAEQAQAPTSAMRDAQAQIQHNREELIHAGLALRAQLNEMVDWRAWYRRTPLVWLGGAFLVGYLVGRPRPRTSR
jgi:hypothetical protein